MIVAAFRFIYKREAKFGMLAVALMWVLVMLTTRSTFFGDTRFFEADIASYLDGRTPFAKLIDFGHLIWRPLGVLLAFHGDASYEATLTRVHVAFLSLNLIASLACVLMLWELLRLTKMVAASVAILVAAAFATTNAFVCLSRSGSPWLPGLACVLLGCCCTLVAEQRHRTGQAAGTYWIGAVLATALAVVFWVPYLLTALPIVCAGLLDRPDIPHGKVVWRAAVRVLPGAAILLILAFGWAVYTLHISNVHELRAWISAAAHGGERGNPYVRAFFGFPRSFFILGDNGIVWKQFLFHDPFARVTALDVAEAGTLILMLFYGTLIWAGWFFVRDGRILGAVIWVTAGVVPTIALAMLFEAGSVERYLALYPMVFVVMGCLVTCARTPKLLRILLVLLIMVQVGNNLYANFAPRIERISEAELARIAPLENRPGGATVFGLNQNDKLSEVYERPGYATRSDLPQVMLLVPAMYSRSAQWRFFFSKSARERWAGGGEVWVSKRAWASQPLRQWLWVENDDPRIRWADIHSFAMRLDTDAEAGGDDGFFRIANTTANRDRIVAAATQP